MGTTEARQQRYRVAKNVINIYAEPSTGSEVTSQAIFAAPLQELERSGDFVQVIGEDRYSGWVQLKFLAPEPAPDTVPSVAVTENTADSFSVVDLFADVYAAADENSQRLTRLVISTRVHVTGEPSSEFVSISLLPVSRALSKSENREAAVTSWIKRSCIAKPPAVADISNWDKSPQQREVLIKMLGQRVVETAKRFIGVPYLWGGCTPFGIDCSGLTQLCYKIEGIQLLRDTYLQSDDKRFVEVESGKTFDKANFLPGDIVVFNLGGSRGGGQPNMHIGIACGGGQFIHSSGRERNFGVYIDSCSESFYAERYMKALRLSPNADLSIA